MKKLSGPVAGGRSQAELKHPRPVTAVSFWPAKLPMAPLPGRAQGALDPRACYQNLDTAGPAASADRWAHAPSLHTKNPRPRPTTPEHRSHQRHQGPVPAHSTSTAIQQRSKKRAPQRRPSRAKVDARAPKISEPECQFIRATEYPSTLADGSSRITGT